MTDTSPPAAVAIANILYRYAELVDAGRFEDLPAELFGDARFVVAPPPAPTLDAEAMAALMVRTTFRYPDGDGGGPGTPRTRHVITNPIIEVDEAAGTATCRSCYTVLQQVDDGPLQPVICGRYHDRFVRRDGVWRLAERDYTLMDMLGDVSRHLRFDPRRRPSRHGAG
jgi:3-phenylpropionate/cinnamic acid dioxygenase small subunit